VRRCITSFFRDRHCYCMKRPVVDEVGRARQGGVARRKVERGGIGSMWPKRRSGRCVLEGKCCPA